MGGDYDTGLRRKTLFAEVCTITVRSTAQNHATPPTVVQREKMSKDSSRMPSPEFIGRQWVVSNEQRGFRRSPPAPTALVATPMPVQHSVHFVNQFARDAPGLQHSTLATRPLGRQSCRILVFSWDPRFALRFCAPSPRLPPQRPSATTCLDRNDSDRKSK